MVNEERVKLMTKMALYESKAGRKELEITRYLPGDYMAMQMIWSFVCATAAFVIMGVIWALYNIESLMLELFSMDILAFARNVLLIYVVFLAVYMGLCYCYYSIRYGKYKKRVNTHILRIKELYRHYVQNDNPNV